MESSDQDLAQRLVALVALRERLFRLAMRETRSPAMAEDAVQNAFVAFAGLWTEEGPIDDPEGFITKRVVGEARRLRRRPPPEVPLDWDPPADRPGADTDESRTIAAIQEAMRYLADSDRAIFDVIFIVHRILPEASLRDLARSILDALESRPSAASEPDREDPEGGAREELGSAEGSARGRYKTQLSRARARLVLLMYLLSFRRDPDALDRFLVILWRGDIDLEELRDASGRIRQAGLLPQEADREIDFFFRLDHRLHAAYFKRELDALQRVRAYLTNRQLDDALDRKHASKTCLTNSRAVATSEPRFTIQELRAYLFDGHRRLLDHEYGPRPRTGA